MKKLIFVSLLATGCADDISEDILNKSYSMCKDNKGLKSISIDTTKVEKYAFRSANCNNGAIFDYKYLFDSSKQ